MIPFHLFPSRKAHTNEVFDTEDFMDMFGPILGSLGNLGFHNFNHTNSFTRSHISRTAIFRTAGASGLLDHGMDLTTAPTASSGTEMDMSLDWQSVYSLERFFYTSMLIISGKAQVMRDITSADPEVMGFQLAIRIDGFIYEDFATGGRQSSNDPAALYYPVGYKGLNTLALVPILEGNHIIELVARTSRNKDFDEASSIPYYLGNAYLSYLECLI